MCFASIRPGLANLFTIMGSIKCGKSLAGCKYYLILPSNSTFIFPRKIGKGNYVKEREMHILTYCLCVCHRVLFWRDVLCNFGNENSNTDHVKCSRGSNAGHRFPTPALDKHCSISLILLDGSGTQWLLPCGIGFMAKRMSEVFMHWLFPWLTAENLKLNWAKMIPDEGNQIAFLDTVLENPIRIVNG